MKGTLCLLTLLGFAFLGAFAQDDTTSASESTETPVALCSEEISDQCPDIDPDEPVILPDPDNCAKFCECSYGEAFSFTCPPETLFDPELGVCNSALAVDCGDRPIEGGF